MKSELLYIGPVLIADFAISFGPVGTFLIFGIFATLTFIFTIRFIPETKGKTLEELEEILIKKG